MYGRTPSLLCSDDIFMAKQDLEKVFALVNGPDI